MKSRCLLAALTSMALTAATGETLATEKLKLSVTPNVSSAPGNVIVRTQVAKDRGNRWLLIEADSGSFYRSSAVELDGDHAPLVTEFRLNNLPSGEYTVAAVLRSSAGEEITVRRTLLVLGRSGEPR
jgi:hypothetical protein